MQIGSALASAVGQWVRMPENRLRILVACGAGGGIVATFNAPVTGVFFGVEIILREFSIDAAIPGPARPRAPTGAARGRARRATGRH